MPRKHNPAFQARVVLEALRARNQLTILRTRWRRATTLQYRKGPAVNSVSEKCYHEGCRKMESRLHQPLSQFTRMVDSLGLKRLTTRYCFMPTDKYEALLSRDVGEAMRVYWSETLDRAHIAAVTATLRSRHWLSAVLSTESETMRWPLPPHSGDFWSPPPILPRRCGAFR